MGYNCRSTLVYHSIVKRKMKRVDSFYFDILDDFYPNIFNYSGSPGFLIKFGLNGRPFKRKIQGALCLRR